MHEIKKKLLVTIKKLYFNLINFFFSRREARGSLTSVWKNSETPKLIRIHDNFRIIHELIT